MRPVLVEHEFLYPLAIDQQLLRLYHAHVQVALLLRLVAGHSLIDCLGLLLLLLLLLLVSLKELPIVLVVFADVFVFRLLDADIDEARVGILVELLGCVLVLLSWARHDLTLRQRVISIGVVERLFEVVAI